MLKGRQYNYIPVNKEFDGGFGNVGVFTVENFPNKRVAIKQIPKSNAKIN